MDYDGSFAFYKLWVCIGESEKPGVSNTDVYKMSGE